MFTTNNPIQRDRFKVVDLAQLVEQSYRVNELSKIMKFYFFNFKNSCLSSVLSMHALPFICKIVQ